MNLPSFTLSVVPVLPALPSLIALVAAGLPVLLSALFSLRHPQVACRMARFLWRQRIALSVAAVVVSTGYFAVRSFPVTAGGPKRPLSSAAGWTMDRGGLLRHGREIGSQDPITSERVWEFCPRGIRFLSSPTVVEDQVFVIGSQDDRGRIYCLDATTGSLNWSCRPTDYRATFSSPTVGNGRLLVGEGLHHVRTGRLICVDLQDRPGQVRWAFATNGHVECTPTIVDDRVYFGAGDDGIYCLQMPLAADKEPTPVWHVSGPDYADAETALAVYKGRVYMGLGVGGHALVALDAGTGEEISRLSLPYPVFSPPAIEGDKLYVGMGIGDYITANETPAGQVCCIDLSTMRLAWSFPIRGTVLGSVAILPDSLVFASSDGTVYRLRHDGSLIDSRSVGSSALASPAVGDRYLYLMTDDGHLHCLAVDRLLPVWRQQVATEGHCIASPVLAHDSVFAASETGGLLRIGRPDNLRVLNSWRGPGGFPGAAGCDPDALLGDAGFELWSSAVCEFLDNDEGTVTGPVARAGQLLVVPAGSHRGSHLIALETDRIEQRQVRLCWRANTAGPVRRSPVIVDDRVAVTCRPSPRHAGRLQCFQLNSGALLWQMDLAADSPAVLIGDEQGIVVQNDPERMSCLDWQGRRQWSRSLGPCHSFVAATPAILIAAAEAPAQLVALDRPTGIPLWRVDLDHPPAALPVPVQDRLLVATADGLELRSLVDGRLVHSVTVSGGVGSELWCDGTEFVLSTESLEMLSGQLPDLSIRQRVAGATRARTLAVATDGILLASGSDLLRLSRTPSNSPSVWYALPSGQEVTGQMLITQNRVLLVVDQQQLVCLTGVLH